MSALSLLVPLALAAQPALDADSCLDLLHGIGRARDLRAARACLEAAVASPCPDSSSPDLARAELAVMYLDGQGGPAEPARAWALLQGCFEDMTTQGLREAFAHREPSGRFDFCAEIGGTTLTMKECGALAGRAQEVRREKAAARLRARLPSDARAKLDRAERSWTAFARAAAAVAADDARGGTAAGLFWLSAWTDLTRQRAEWLGGLEGLLPEACRDPGLRAEDDRLNVAYRAVRKGLDEEGARLLRDAERAWIASRDGDAALAAAWQGPALETAVRCLATRARAEALEKALEQSEAR